MPAIIELQTVFILSNADHEAILLHDCHDDSRYICLSCGVKVKFTSNLNVFIEDKQIGFIRTIEDTYHLEKTDGTLHNLMVKCNDRHWKNLKEAEIKAAVYLNSVLDKTKDQFSDSAFEEFVKNELGDIAVKDQDKYISAKISNYKKVWDHVAQLCKS